MRNALTLALLLATAGTFAQHARPDFSGDRVLNREASRLSPAMAGVQSGSLAIQHREPTVSVRLILVQNGQPFETNIERTTDGREVAGATGVSSFTWDGDVLVFNARARGPNCEGTLAIRYELENDGRRIRATEAIRGCDRDQDNMWVFERQ